MIRGLRLINAAENNDVFTELLAALQPFDTPLLLQALASLHSRPENQSNCLRIDAAIHAACQNLKSPKGKAPTAADLQKIFDNHLGRSSPLATQEDPPEHLFTENVMFHGGNFTVFPGLDLQGSFSLQQTLEAVFQNNDSRLDKLRELLRPSCIAVLKLSDLVAGNAGLKRNDFGSDDKHWNVPVPPQDELNERSNAVLISDDTLSAVLRFAQAEWNDIEPFFLTPERLDVYGEYSINRHPLLLHPLLGLDQGTLVLSAPSICGALRNYIWNHAIDLKVSDVVAEHLSKELWHEVLRAAFLMDFRQVELKVSPPPDNPHFREAYFQFDFDKIAVVHLITDGSVPYTKDQPFEHVPLGGQTDTLEARRETLESELSSDFGDGILFLTLVGSSGRGTAFGYNPPERGLGLMIGVYELAFLPFADIDLDNLTLWKIARLKKRISSRTEILCWCFLDLLGFYKARGCSLYAGDEAVPSHISVAPNFCKDILKIALPRADWHLAYHRIKDSFVKVARRYHGEDSPVYFAPNPFAKEVSHVVSTDEALIWVTYDLRNDDVTEGFQAGFVDTFSYWIWQLLTELPIDFKSLLSRGLEIRVRVTNHDRWTSQSSSSADTGSVRIGHSAENHTLSFELPDELIPLVHEPHNQADRLIVEAILKGLNSYGESKDYPKLGESLIQEILDRVAPFGLKKKLLSLDPTRDVSLMPVTEERLRSLSHHDKQEWMDTLPQSLDRAHYSVGEITDQEKVKQLCNDIVQNACNEVRRIIDSLAAAPLLHRLLLQNETAIHGKRFQDKTRPFTIACYTGFDAALQRLLREMPDASATSISLRALIEMVVAQPPNGKAYPTDETLDRLVALTHLMLLYAQVSDEVHLKIANRTLSVLPSERIGLDRSGHVGFPNDFFLEQLKESESDRIKSVTDSSPFVGALRDLLDSKEAEEAFPSEFGLTKEQLFLFFQEAAHHAIAEGKDVLVESKIDFVNEIKQKLPELSEIEILNTVDMFSLKHRDQWTPKSASEAREVLPSRFNRKLSLIARPFAELKSDTRGELICYGPRQVELSAIHLFGQIHSGSFRQEKEKMEALQSKIQNIRGGELARSVFDWTNEQKNTSDIVLKGVEIGPNGPLSANELLGDIDVLYYCKENQVAYSIECKCVFFAKEIYQFRNELQKFDENSPKSEISKHIRRQQWLENNLTALSNLLGVTIEKVESLIVTSEAIPTPYVRKTKLPIIFFSQLKSSGLPPLGNH